MTVRKMTAADLPAVVELDQMSFSQPWPPAAFDTELANPRARCWVTEQDGRVLAALIIWLVMDEAHIATIAVHPDVRRQGIGRDLLKAGMDAAYAEGSRIFHLEVRDSNLAAQKMYEAFGYVVVGRRPKYYKNNGEDALLMSKVYSQRSESDF